MRDTTTSEFTDEGTKMKGPKVCSSKKVLLFTICSIISAAGIVGLVYYFRPNFSRTKILKLYNGDLPKEESPDEILQNKYLSKNVIPKYYRLHFEPDFNKSFNAQITITLECKESTDNIMLHMKNLNITKIEITTMVRLSMPKNSTNETANSVFFSRNIGIFQTFKAHSKLLIKLREVLVKDAQYFLNINYSGVFHEKHYGFVEKEYLDGTGDRKIIISTKTQPIYARTIFPCFDEFGFDAQFEISIAKKTNMVALSNTCMKDSEVSNKHPGLVWNHFETTGLMPARQISFVIGEIKSVDVSLKKPGPVVKLWARKPHLNQIKYLSKLAADVLDFFRNYFSVNCPLEKIDFVLVPDLGKAVEGHLGLILLRESTFIFSRDTTDMALEKYVFELISEAVVKQWLDAFLSDDSESLLLHQGLAKYMTYISQTALINPSALDNFGLEILQPTLLEDAVAGINVANEIDEDHPLNIFDKSIENKIASIFRMVGETFGEDHFRKEVVWTLKERNQTRIFNSLGRIHPFAEKVMKSFLESSGFPLISVKFNLNTCTITIQQRIFGNMMASSEKWIIPLKYTTKWDSAARHEILDQSGVKINVNCLNNTWFLFNINQIGYYRVNYDLDNWNALINQLKENISEIPTFNRVELINDAFELANFGYIEHRIPFALLNYLKNEQNVAPWKAALNSLDWIEGIMAETQHFGIYKDYVLNLLDSKEIVYNFTKNDPINALKMNKICSMRFKPCTDKALKLFDDSYINNTQQLLVLPQFKYTIYCLGIESGSEEYWDFIWERSKSASSWEKEIMYSALGCSRDTWKLTSYLEKTLDGSISLELVKHVWKSLAEKPVGKLVGLNFLETRWDEIYKSYKQNNDLLKGIITEFLNYLGTEIDLKKVAIFYNKHRTELKPMSKLMKIALTKIKTRVSWKEKFLDSVLSIISENGDQGD